MLRGLWLAVKPDHIVTVVAPTLLEYSKNALSVACNSGQ
jgi:hypothetical protein